MEKAVFLHHRGLRESSIKLLRARLEGEERSEVEGKKISGRAGFYRRPELPGKQDPDTQTHTKLLAIIHLENSSRLATAME
jgi:hypothetical protein